MILLLSEPVSLFILSRWELVLLFLKTYRRGNRKEESLWLGPLSSAGRKRRLSLTVLQTPRGQSGPSVVSLLHLWLLLWQLLAFSHSESVNEMWPRRRWKDSPESPEPFPCGEKSVCQVTTRPSLLRNKPRQAPARMFRFAVTFMKDHLQHRIKFRSPY